MNKQLVFIGILALLVTVGLSGCTNIPLDAERNKFVGTWVYTEQGYYGPINYTYVFFSDGTYSYNSIMGTYELKEGKLIMGLDVSAKMVYNYQFSDNDIILILSFVGSDNEMVLIKQ